jgi:hypothetical protein
MPKLGWRGSGGCRTSDGAPKCAATLRVGAAESEAESPSRAIRQGNGRSQGAQLKLAVRTSKTRRTSIPSQVAALTYLCAKRCRGVGFTWNSLGSITGVAAVM